MKRLFFIAALLFNFTFALSQPNHQRLVYSHSLTNNGPTAGEQIENLGGSFIPERGWKADTKDSQLRIHLSEPLPSEGTFIIDVTNFDPASQSIPDMKQHIINLYSRIYDNNKDIFNTDGSWWNIRTGTAYSSGEGMAGFKFLAAPRGIDTRDEARCIEDATWDLNRVYEFKVVWTTSNIFCYLDDQLLTTFNFSGQVEPFRHILIGKDNLIWGYCAQPGPIYSNIRIYTSGTDPAPSNPPKVACFATVSDSLLRILFDRTVDVTSATDVNNYAIDQGVSVRLAVLDSTGTTVDLHTTRHSISTAYHLSIVNIADASNSASTLDTTIAYTFPQELKITDISRSNYYVDQKAVGDSAYSDRNYKITSIPEQLAHFDWIVTANDDKQQTDESFLTFCINKPITIIVAYDSTVETLPEWLQGWQANGLIIRTEDTAYRCYQRVAAPCRVTLGGNAGPSSSSMYLVLVGDTVDTTPPAAPTGVRIVW